MSENLVQLDLSRLTRSDIAKIHALGARLSLMHRWFRCESVDDASGDAYAVYSGDRGPRRYAAYRVVRERDGAYGLLDHRSGATLARAKAIDTALDAIPDDFYYTG